MKKITAISLLALSMFASSFVVTQAQLSDGDDIASTTVCLDLQSGNLTAGATDSNTNGEVSKLQDFLMDRGYLTTSAATGYYGNLTVKAVIAYQKAKNVPQVGRVGPLSRSLIKADTCGGTAQTTTPSLTSVSFDTSSQKVIVEGSNLGDVKKLSYRTTTTGGTVLTSILENIVSQTVSKVVFTYGEWTKNVLSQARSSMAVRVTNGSNVDSNEVSLNGSILSGTATTNTTTTNTSAKSITLRDSSTTNGSIITRVKSTVTGAGPDIIACTAPMSSKAAFGGTPTNSAPCSQLSQFVVLKTQTGWSYNANTDTYSMDMDVSSYQWPDTSYYTVYIYPDGTRIEKSWNPGKMGPDLQVLAGTTQSTTSATKSITLRDSSTTNGSIILRVKATVTGAGPDIKGCTGPVSSKFVMVGGVAPCTNDSDFVVLKNQVGWAYNSPTDTYYMDMDVSANKWPDTSYFTIYKFPDGTRIEKAWNPGKMTDMPVLPGTTASTQTANVALKVSSATSPSGPWTEGGSVCNTGMLYARVTGVSKSQNPKGCASLVGSSACLVTSAHRDYLASEWVDDNTIQTYVDARNFPVSMYDSYISYPNGQIVKAGVFGIKSCQAAAPTCNYLKDGAPSAVFGGTAMCTPSIVGQEAPGVPGAVCTCK